MSRPRGAPTRVEDDPTADKEDKPCTSFPSSVAEQNRIPQMAGPEVEPTECRDVPTEGKNGSCEGQKWPYLIFELDRLLELSA